MSTDQEAVVLDRSVGETAEAPVHVVDPDSVLAYVLATNDDPCLYDDLSIAPPVFAAVVSYPAVKELLFRVVPDAILPASVHLSQVMRFHRPIRVGHTLRSRAQAIRIRTTPFGVAICFKATIVDDDGPLINESFHDVLLRGARGESAGGDVPEPRFSRRSATGRLGEMVFDIAEDQSIRYSLASNDMHPVHNDPEFARTHGFPNLILHGMCTLAMCGQAVVRFAAGGDPTRIRSLAATFTDPVIVGRQLRVTVDGGPNREVGVAASQLSRSMIRHGVAQVDD